MKSLLFGVLTFTICGKAQAWTGNDVWEKCQTNGQGVQGAYDKGWCSGFIFGVIDDWGWVRYTSPFGIERICVEVPDNVTYGQMQDIVLDYIKSHPKDRHKDATELINAALYDSWPCEIKKK